MSDANVGSGAFGVGFIGLGQIGAPMARHLIGWEGGLTVLDVRAEACEPFAAGGAAVAATPAEVAARSEVISLAPWRPCWLVTHAPSQKAEARAHLDGGLAGCHDH